MKYNQMKYQYYNEDLKKEFISLSVESGRILKGVLDRLFTHTYPYEVANNKDICTFTTAEIREMYKTLNYTAPELIMNMNSQLSVYTQWCLGKGIVLDCQNHYVEIQDFSNYVDIKGLSRKIVTRKELLAKISGLSNPSDQFALLAIFEGINGIDRKEITNLHITDFEGNIANLCTGRKVEVSDKLLELAVESSNTTTYVTSNNGRTFKLQDDPTLIVKTFVACKDATPERLKGRRIYFRLNKCLGLIGLEDISVVSVSDSGKIHEINKLAEKHNISGIEVIYDNNLIKEVEERFNAPIYKNVFIKKYGDYLK